MLDLYTDATPNGLKISIALDELGLDYNVHQVHLGGGQFTEEFSRLNPNNKIPVLVDHDRTVTESGAILLYLAERSGKLLPADADSRTRAIELLMFQMASLGPMFGQFLVFAAAWDNRFPEVTQRYFDEVARILKVLNTRLAGSRYLAGDEYSVADIACFPWIRLCLVHPAAAQLPFQRHANLVAWYERVADRPAVLSGLRKPEPFAPDVQFKAFVDATIGVGRLHSPTT
jgi:GST-like protein